MAESQNKCESTNKSSLKGLFWSSFKLLHFHKLDSESSMSRDCGSRDLVCIIGGLIIAAPAQGVVRPITEFE